MKDIEFTVQEIKELMAAMHKHQIGGLRIEQGSFQLKLEAARPEVVAAPALRPAPPPAAEEESQLSGNVIHSPIVGTFYASPAPDQPPFIKVGDSVKEGDVLFIIESMKLMNEVTSEYSGTVTEILVANAQPVEYGQPILTIE